MLKLTQDFSEFLKLLNSEQIEYLVIGGYAVGLYGYVRYTKDLDVWVAVHPLNEERLKNVLTKFGFTRDGLPTPLFDPVKTMLRIGRPPDLLEILSRISGVEFDDCYSRRQPTNVGSGRGCRPGDLSGRPQKKQVLYWAAS